MIYNALSRSWEYFGQTMEGWWQGAGSASISCPSEPIETVVPPVEPIEPPWMDPSTQVVWSDPQLPEPTEINKNLLQWMKKLHRYQIQSALLAPTDQPNSYNTSYQPVLYPDGEIYAAGDFEQSLIAQGHIRVDRTWREVLELALSPHGVSLSHVDGGLLPVCPMRLEPMHYPIRAIDGYVYEGNALLAYPWYSNDTGRLVRSPMHRLPPSISHLEYKSTLHHPLQRALMYGYQLMGVQQLPEVWRDTTDLLHVMNPVWRFRQMKYGLIFGLLCLGASLPVLLSVLRYFSGAAKVSDPLRIRDCKLVQFVCGEQQMDLPLCHSPPHAQGWTSLCVPSPLFVQPAVKDGEDFPSQQILFALSVIPLLTMGYLKMLRHHRKEFVRDCAFSVVRNWYWAQMAYEQDRESLKQQISKGRFKPLSR